MSYLHSDKIKILETKASEIRQAIIDSVLNAESGHIAGALGMTDVFVLLYFHTLKHNPKDPLWEERDRLILSNGHICPALYTTMAYAGYFPIEELKTLRKFGSRLQGHPHREFLPGIETSSGPLGSGLSQAVGMTLADRIDRGRSSNRFFYCLVGDGELQEGQNWEAIQMAGKERLHNLIVIVDRNNIQIDGFTEDVMPLEPLQDKFEAFNWHVINASGHDFDDLDDAIIQAQAVFAKPTVIIAHTIPSKGLGVAERDFRWHGMPNKKIKIEKSKWKITI
ncbi:transketolase [Patescibacteria group bacterium]|nr:transketolase [Patescibacteria group bacterium]MBU1730033.1 transketolase [Patescibacteria group bacterium]MBU1956242.1 transketolase [Patescibacteria group bacterium]MBU2010102.1 transketolase [Patescibacteria group bacterium]